MARKPTQKSGTAELLPRADMGAPAALRAIEEHELRCREEKDIARDSWKAAQTEVVEGDDVSERKLHRARREYLEALETWDDATKKLALFDKQVIPTKREGEKILMTDCQELFRQFRLSIHLAIEDYVICLAQDAARGLSAEEFHHAHAEHIRERTRAALTAAITDGKLPEWANN